MYVDEIKLDYNDSSKAKDMMRIKSSDRVNSKKEEKYAQYFVGI